MHKNNNLKRFLGICTLSFCAFVFFFGSFGCSYWEYDSDDSANAQLGIISGVIDVSQIVAASNIQSSVKASDVDFSSSLVFLEEIASLSARPDLNGKFAIKDVPDGTYYLIVRLSSPLAPSYKVRMNSPLQVSSSSPPPPTTVIVKPGDKADSFIRILLVDHLGNPVNSATVTLWGETFTHEGDGVYLSPAMPVGAIGRIFVAPPPGSSLQGQTLTIATGTFVVTEIPSLGTALSPVGVKNRPPSVWIRPEKFEVSGGDLLKIHSTAVDPDSDELIPAWTARIGTFTQSGIDHAIWQAPNFNATATIAFAVTEKTSKLPVFQAKAQVIIRVIAAKGPDSDTGSDTGTATNTGTNTNTNTDTGSDTSTATSTGTNTDTGSDTGTATNTGTTTD
ncbi:MAG TPA: hypothetical protein DCG57_00320, partial [Candidatus Riflebacteria bacterium]|nr:hypothetical protein [Candidatus Riflebacteria bacterium]